MEDMYKTIALTFAKMVRRELPEGFKVVVSLPMTRGTHGPLVSPVVKMYRVSLFESVNTIKGGYLIAQVAIDEGAFSLFKSQHRQLTVNGDLLWPLLTSSKQSLAPAGSIRFIEPDAVEQAVQFLVVRTGKPRKPSSDRLKAYLARSIRDLNNVDY